LTLATAGEHELLAPIHLQYALEDKYIIQKCECIKAQNLKNRFREVNNEKSYSDEHKLTIGNNILKLIIYSNSKFGTVKLQDSKVISLALGINSFCLCGLRQIQKEYNDTQTQNLEFQLTIQPNLFTRLTQYHTSNNKTLFLYLHNIFHICENVPKGQETLPTLKTLTLAILNVIEINVQTSGLPVTLINDLPKTMDRFLLLRIQNRKFIEWYT
jgi:hypothetical protein